jgi:hypothetical protein
MDERNRLLVGEAAIVVGLMLFAVGAAVLTIADPLDPPVAALGALAAFLVTVGAVMRDGARPPVA